MVYTPAQKRSMLVLRLWRSNYHLQSFHEPIWLGNLNYPLEYQKTNAYRPDYFLSQSLDTFNIRKIPISKKSLRPVSKQSLPVLLLIKSP